MGKQNEFELKICKVYGIVAGNIVMMSNLDFDNIYRLQTRFPLGVKRKEDN